MFHAITRRIQAAAAWVQFDEIPSMICGLENVAR